jgi:hypothetical protein
VYFGIGSLYLIVSSPYLSFPSFHPLVRPFFLSSFEVIVTFISSSSPLLSFGRTTLSAISSSLSVSLPPSSSTAFSYPATFVGKRPCSSSPRKTWSEYDLQTASHRQEWSIEHQTSGTVSTHLPSAYLPLLPVFISIQGTASSSPSYPKASTVLHPPTLFAWAGD